MICYTGNPYVDAGVAVLELRLQKPCAEFAENDLASQAEWIKQEYRKKIWKSYLMLHLPNCAWTQANPDSDKNREYIRKVLDSYKSEFADIGRRCAFCEQPAKILADRRYVPLLTGETNMAAGAQGQPGLPVCGYCVFAIHFYPLATFKVGGKPLFWEAPDSQWIRQLNGNFYKKIQGWLALAGDEMPKLSWRATRLLDAAQEALDEINRLPPAEQPPLCDITGIHATNYGAGASYDEVRIPRGLLEFWREAGAFGDLYHRIEQRAWVNGEAKPKKKGRGRKAGPDKETPAAIREASRKNLLYEALGKAFQKPDFRDEARSVAVHFFMLRRGKEVAPNTIALTEFFLEKVACMEKARLEAIRGIADALVQSRNVNWIVDRLMRSGKTLYDLLPTMRAIERKLSTEKKPLAWDQLLFALGLNDEDDPTSRDSPLVYELMLIRIFEQLGLARPDILSGIDGPDEASQ